MFSHLEQKKIYRGMRKILEYDQFINEMWDTNIDVTPVRKDFRKDEVANYEFEIDGSVYNVFIVGRRYDDAPDDLQIELHFSSKKEGSSDFTNELTGKNNMQKVMAGVWKSLIQWTKEVSKGGNLDSLIISSKSEEQGDERRAKIYADFIARKASQTGMKIIGTEDITDAYNLMMSAFGNTNDTSITTKYLVDNFPIDHLKSL